jgi:hypothetical protein
LVDDQWKVVCGPLAPHWRVPGIPSHLTARTAPSVCLPETCRCSPLLCSSQALVSVNLLLSFELRLNHCILVSSVRWRRGCVASLWGFSCYLTRSTLVSSFIYSWITISTSFTNYHLTQKYRRAPCPRFLQNLPSTKQLSTRFHER